MGPWNQPWTAISLGTAASGKIPAAVAAIDTNVFEDLVTNQGYENTIHTVVLAKAKAAAVGPEQQIKLRRKPDADSHPQ